MCYHTIIVRPFSYSTRRSIKEYGHFHGTCNGIVKLFSKRTISPSAVDDDLFYYNSTSIWCCNYKPLFSFAAVLIDEK